MKGRRHSILIISLKKKKKYIFKYNCQPESDGKGDGLSPIPPYDPIMVRVGGGGKEGEELWKGMAWKDLTFEMGKVEPNHSQITGISSPSFCSTHLHTHVHTHFNYCGYFSWTDCI